MTYITHLTLQTGHASRIRRGDVTGQTLATLRPWLLACVRVGGSHALPASMAQGYSAYASVPDGSLLLTLSGPPMQGRPMAGKCAPLVTIGVAARSRHRSPLWELMTGPVMPPVAADLACPDAPACCVAIWPTLSLHLDAAQWLGDFERCVAWAWIGAKND